MKAKDLRDLVRFSDDAVRTETLYDEERLWSEVVCLQGNQMLGPLSDPVSEGIVTVLAGQVAVQVGKNRTRMKQWGSVHVGSGEELTITNASPEPAVVLVVLAPPPARS